MILTYIVVVFSIIVQGLTLGPAVKHYKKLPFGFRLALTFLGLNRGNSRRFMSYLMFIEPFCRELIDLGYKDGMRQRREVEMFLNIEPSN